MAFAEKTYAFAALNEILPQPSFDFHKAGFICFKSSRTYRGLVREGFRTFRAVGLQ
jgi:hypothetical protein